MSDKNYTIREERANYLTHAFGVVMALVSTVFLVLKALSANDYWALFAYSLFGFGMIVCMLSSTMYHFIQEPILKSKLRHLDHASIYLLIAASYTPFTAILLRENKIWGWTLFCLVWMMALAGGVISFRKLKKNSHLKTISYVAMGLTVVIALKPLLSAAHAKDSMGSIWLLFGGGVFYIIGAVFYALAKREFIHTVFHVFVLCGLACHIIAAFLIPIS